MMRVWELTRPVMEPTGSPDIPDLTTLAVFKTEIAENETPAGIQIDTPRSSPSPSERAGSSGSVRTLSSATASETSSRGSSNGQRGGTKQGQINDATLSSDTPSRERRSAGVPRMVAAPASRSSETGLNPQLTPTGNIPAFRAVMMSTSESPTK